MNGMTNFQQYTDMNQKIELTGQKFSKLVVVDYSHSTKNGTYWNCVCECGHTDKVNSRNLRNGAVKSCGCSRLGINKMEKHGLWKNKPSYKTLHVWVRRNFTQPRECVACGNEETLDLANISGEYKRDLKDFAYLCRRCHMISDGRLEKYSYRKGTNPTIGKTWLNGI